MSLDSIVRLWFGMNSGPGRVVERTEVAGLTISTIDTNDDMGFETAIFDAVDTIPVERYASEELARAGHARWVALAPTLTRVTKLGYLDLVEDEDVDIQREPRP